MKTNHLRRFKAKTHRANSGFSETRVEPLVDKKLHVNVLNEAMLGRRRGDKAKRGAKKFLNSRTRFHQNTSTRKLVRGELE